MTITLSILRNQFLTNTDMKNEHTIKSIRAIPIYGIPYSDWPKPFARATAGGGPFSNTVYQTIIH